MLESFDYQGVHFLPSHRQQQALALEGAYHDPYFLPFDCKHLHWRLW